MAQYAHLGANIFQGIFLCGPLEGPISENAPSQPRVSAWRGPLRAPGALVEFTAGCVQSSSDPRVSLFARHRRIKALKLIQEVPLDLGGIRGPHKGGLHVHTALCLPHGQKGKLGCKNLHIEACLFEEGPCRGHGLAGVSPGLEHHAFSGGKSSV